MEGRQSATTALESMVEAALVELSFEWLALEHAATAHASAKRRGECGKSGRMGRRLHGLDQGISSRIVITS
jgi:hypothetical protein